MIIFVFGQITFASQVQFSKSVIPVSLYLFHYLIRWTCLMCFCGSSYMITCYVGLYLHFPRGESNLTTHPCGDGLLIVMAARSANHARRFHTCSKVIPNVRRSKYTGNRTLKHVASRSLSQVMVGRPPLDLGRQLQHIVSNILWNRPVQHQLHGNILGKCVYVWMYRFPVVSNRCQAFGSRRLKQARLNPLWTCRCWFLWAPPAARHFFRV